MSMKAYSKFSKAGASPSDGLYHIQDTRWSSFTRPQRSNWCIPLSQPNGLLKRIKVEIFLKTNNTKKK